ncbi:hypothetical protein AKJ37_02065 [candidate division MSBL1 archaeon SCGC-AAA259I09]|uniref:Uncharacterized protein n=4 Tax=candidate division MSBL1 TaxID=215777 RepID=A0A133UUK3_9EURY|nr:hypothetical protein AKJ61_01405 [candidate division MSBL1 archaeon SCGC-AAA259B11]KXA93702.1 hypothetical protein AKJ66_01340 [candidate division MSBL1 archaeon SCGC-AAA259E22]KXA97894.1 hypothetical protein AKJ37_02065 [candidate division MSBL1 archaeon SCGC-AAA259I09]KXB00334.1 hypothetical protein AKJ40_01485 [candidate division MSBL1 archaeon SCGC-AAA259M10]
MLDRLGFPPGVTESKNFSLSTEKPSKSIISKDLSQSIISEMRLKIPVFHSKHWKRRFLRIGYRPRNDKKGI